MTTTTPSEWRGLYWAGAAGAALTAVCIPLQVLFYIAWPPPASREVADWFALYNDSPIRGLLSMDLVMMTEQILLFPLVIALWVVLRRSSASLALLGSVLWLTGGLLLVASNTAFEMLSLARGFAVAATEAERASYIAAGRGMLAGYFDMGSGFVFGYVMSSLGGLLAGAAMLRAPGWARSGWILLAGSVLGLCIFLPVVGIGLSLVSVIVLLFWYALVAIRLARLAGSESRATGRAPAAQAPATA